jgi:hypothetical protein
MNEIEMRPDDWLTDRGTWMMPPPVQHAVTAPTFPAKWRIDCPSGPVFSCDVHAGGVISFSRAVGFQPEISRADYGHNCRGCVAVYKARFKEGRAYGG